MKVTKKQLKQILKEEITVALSEVEWRPTDVAKGPPPDSPRRKKEREDSVRQSTRDRAAIDDAYYECLQAHGGLDSDEARYKCDAELKESVKETLKELYPSKDQ